MSNDIVSTDSTPRLSAALSFIRRGWPVLMLHDVVMGFCSCGDTSAKHLETSAGKHPMAKAWQNAGITDEEIMRSVYAGRPGMNIGIRTGLQAGIWVLDVDPKHEGDKRLSELEAEHGALPYTYTVRTGSGGVHHYWLLPEDFTPSSSPGALPKGLDVRGEVGQVVAPPSITGIGAYEVLLDLPLVAAPGWLLEMIRPRVPADREHAEVMTHWDSPLLASQSDRLMRYGHAAMLAELTKLAQAVPGERGSVAYRVACNLIELINSPWAGLGEGMVKGQYANAAGRAMAHGGAFDDAEAWASWGSAARRVGARGRAAPDSPGGVLLGWNQLGGVPPFSPGQASGGSSGTSSGISTGATFLDNYSHGFPPFPQDQSSANAPGGVTDDLFPPGFPQDQSSANATDPISELVSRFISGKTLSEMPPPQWLIKDWVVQNSICWVVGKSGDGKSFVALDQVMHVALGRAWRGKRVHKGRAGYMVAEGAPGMGQRYKAWCKRHNDEQDVDDVMFLPFPVQAGDMAAWDALIAAVHRMRLDVLVLDTQARVTVGMEENSAKEMGLFVEQVERLRRATGTTVMVVHHHRKAGGEARGSGALYGAAQTEITVTRNADVITITVTKQKDAEAPLPVALQLVSEVVGVIPGVSHGWVSTPDEPLTAGVLIDVDLATAGEWLGLGAKARVLKVLTDIFPGRGATKAEARSEAIRRGVSQSAFYRAWDACLTEKLIAVVVVDDRPTTRYVVVPVSERT